MMKVARTTELRWAILAVLVGVAIWAGASTIGQAKQPAEKDRGAAVAAGNGQPEDDAKKVSGTDAEKGTRRGQVNVRDFDHLAVAGDWSPAIQAAIDHVTARNGYEHGATIFFPPGTYHVNNTIRLGKDPAHYGTRLRGYGAVLKGTKALDQQPLDYEERREALTEKKDKFSLTALPGELDFDGKNVGVPILELWNPNSQEGASYVIAGLTFDREAGRQGVGIKIPAETVPKNVTFRDIKVHRQNVGVHVNASWQIRFESCILRGNHIGVWGRNHFNSVSIVNSTFRRQHLHGLVIGPNAGTWGSSGIHIAGNIFEANKGYGILNRGGVQVAILGNYFEANGNSIGIFSPFGNTTVDTNHFWGFYGHGWKMNRHGDQVVSDKSHIVVSSKNVQLRNNRYGKGQGILVFELSGKNTFDDLALIANGVTFPHGTKVADSGGLGAYVYSTDTGKFVFREFDFGEQATAADGEAAAAE